MTQRQFSFFDRTLALLLSLGLALPSVSDTSRVSDTVLPSSHLRPLNAGLEERNPVNQELEAALGRPASPQPLQGSGLEEEVFNFALAARGLDLSKPGDVEILFAIRNSLHSISPEALGKLPKARVPPAKDLTGHIAESFLAGPDPDATRIQGIAAIQVAPAILRELRGLLDVEDQESGLLRNPEISRLIFEAATRGEKNYLVFEKNRLTLNPVFVREVMADVETAIQDLQDSDEEGRNAAGIALLDVAGGFGFYERVRAALVVAETKASERGKEILRPTVGAIERMAKDADLNLDQQSPTTPPRHRLPPGAGLEEPKVEITSAFLFLIPLHERDGFTQQIKALAVDPTLGETPRVIKTIETFYIFGEGHKPYEAGTNSFLTLPVSAVKVPGGKLIVYVDAARLESILGNLSDRGAMDGAMARKKVSEFELNMVKESSFLRKYLGLMGLFELAAALPAPKRSVPPGLEKLLRSLRTGSSRSIQRREVSYDGGEIGLSAQEIETGWNAKPPTLNWDEALGKLSFADPQVSAAVTRAMKQSEPAGFAGIFYVHSSTSGQKTEELNLDDLILQLLSRQVVWDETWEVFKKVPAAGLEEEWRERAKALLEMYDLLPTLGESLGTQAGPGVLLSALLGAGRQTSTADVFEQYWKGLVYILFNMKGDTQALLRQLHEMDQNAHMRGTSAGLIVLMRLVLLGFVNSEPDSLQPFYRQLKLTLETMIDLPDSAVQPSPEVRKSGEKLLEEALPAIVKRTAQIIGYPNPDRFNPTPDPAGLEEGEKFGSVREFLDSPAGKWLQNREPGLAKAANILGGAASQIIVVGERGAQEENVIAYHYTDWPREVRAQLENNFVQPEPYPANGKLEEARTVIIQQEGKGLPSEPKPNKVPRIVVKGPKALKGLTPGFVYTVAVDETFAGQVIGPIIGVITFEDEHGRTLHAVFA